jgi:hypothetical protein
MKAKLILIRGQLERKIKDEIDFLRRDVQDWCEEAIEYLDVQASPYSYFPESKMSYILDLTNSYKAVKELLARDWINEIDAGLLRSELNSIYTELPDAPVITDVELELYFKES